MVIDDGAFTNPRKKNETQQVSFTSQNYENSEKRSGGGGGGGVWCSFVFISTATALPS